MSNKWRQKIHLEPEHGWINDPNGLCYKDGKYHVFFQYTPEDADGNGKRCWGHFESVDDAKTWTYTGIAVKPDIPEDKDGVFSGSAVVEGDEIHLFYTGNVSEPGREANQIHVITKDGRTIGEKSVILRQSDYPDSCTYDVRDPKVWIENGKWKMVLGARTNDNKGCVLLYEAENPDNWGFVKKISEDDCGYMWECPDIFSIDGHKFLSVSPQGLKHEEYRNQNVYSSGYFKLKDGQIEGFEEFDYGFDFYAPQTFVNEYDERILIAWMGMGDAEYTNPTAQLGWQHCLTIPRKLSLTDDGHLRQWPVINHDLYGRLIENEPGREKFADLPCDIVAMIDSDEYEIRIDNADIRYKDGVLIFELIKGDIGKGRDAREALIGELKDLRIIVDTSSIEIFINGGRYVMSSRFYPASDKLRLISHGGGFLLRQIRTMEVKKLGE